jgi:hypothetical protein
MSRSAPSWLATVVGDCYTLHFWPPYGDPEVQQAGHYTGWAEEGRLNRRLIDHFMGRGGRLPQVQREAGGTWVVADVERGVTRDRETQLKERGATRRCSVCKASRDIEAGRITKEEALAKWPDASPAERGILREIFGMEPEPEVPDPVPLREFIPARQPELEPEITPEMDALVDSLCEGWLREKAEAEARAKAEAGAEAGPEQVRELRSERLAEVPAPRQAPEPQMQAEVTPQITAPTEDWTPQPEAEPELELEIG